MGEKIDSGRFDILAAYSERQVWQQTAAAVGSGARQTPADAPAQRARGNAAVGQLLPPASDVNDLADSFLQQSMATPIAHRSCCQGNGLKGRGPPFPPLHFLRPV